MGKNKNTKPQVEAPVVDKPEEVTAPAQTVLPQPNPAMKGMSQDSKVLMFATLHDRYGKDPQARETNPTIKYLNAMTDALGVDVLVTEARIKGTTFGQIISKSSDLYGAMKELCATYQINFDEKALPAPTQEQLAAAGITGKPEDHVVVEISDKTIGKETKERVDKEQDLLTKFPPVDKPEEVTDENVLKSSLIKLFKGQKSPTNRMINAIAFYRGYLDFKKADHSEMTDEDILNDIVALFGEYPPFQELGILGTYFKQLSDYKSVVPTYLITKKSADSETSQVKNMPDGLITAIARTYSKWGAMFQKGRDEKNLEARKAMLEKAKKEKNNQLVKECELFIDRLTASIANADACLAILNNPSDEGIEDLAKNYATDEDTFEHKVAVRIVNGINNVYHKGKDLSKCTADSVMGYAVQRAGLIVNLFRSPMEQLSKYSVAYLPELVEVEPEEKPTEEAPAEESKN